MKIKWLYHLIPEWIPNRFSPYNLYEVPPTRKQIPDRAVWDTGSLQAASMRWGYCILLAHLFHRTKEGANLDCLFGISRCNLIIRHNTLASIKPLPRLKFRMESFFLGTLMGKGRDIVFPRMALPQLKLWSLQKIVTFGCDLCSSRMCI